MFFVGFIDSIIDLISKTVKHDTAIAIISDIALVTFNEKFNNFRR